MRSPQNNFIQVGVTALIFNVCYITDTKSIYNYIMSNPISLLKRLNVRSTVIVIHLAYITVKYFLIGSTEVKCFSQFLTDF